ncbi:MAG: acyltransferase [Oscillospiraceae bacterium]|nr:acyltransferase [Oscillospiraceae bacterium]MBQ7130652.1 acyltransferase [Oscillospiraceae bacterium]
MERKSNVNMVMFDFAKGLAMLAVVFIHSGAVAEHDTYPVVLIRSVVVAVFFMASGFWLRKRKVKTGIRLAAQQLLIPYAVTLGIILVIGFVHRLLTRDLQDYLELFLLPVLKRGAGPRTGALWFLVATFQTWCMYYLLMRLKDARLRFALVILGAVVGMGLLPIHDYTYLLPQSLLMLPYIYGGYWIREKGLFDKEVPAWLLIVMSVPALVLAAFGKIDVIMDTADFGILNIAAQLLFGYALIYVTLLINAKQWKWTEWIMQIGRHSLWVLCIHSIEMSVFPWSILWRFAAPESVAGILAHFVLRSVGILVGCLALRKGQRVLHKRKKQRSKKKNG